MEERHRRLPHWFFVLTQFERSTLLLAQTFVPLLNSRGKKKDIRGHRRNFLARIESYLNGSKRLHVKIQIATCRRLLGPPHHSNVSRPDQRLEVCKLHDRIVQVN